MDGGRQRCRTHQRQHGTNPRSGWHHNRWNYYGEKAIEYLFGSKAIRIYRIFFVAAVIVGATTSLEFVWNFSDLMNGMMAIPNLIGLLLLSKVINAETERYFKE
jgi:AGCS family alanine or glycine:cation symporter